MCTELFFLLQESLKQMRLMRVELDYFMLIRLFYENQECLLISAQKVLF